MLIKCCTQYVSKFGKPRSGHRTGQGQFSFQFPRRVVLKKCSNYWTIALIFHASKVMLKIQQGRNPLIPDSQELRMPHSPLITTSQGIRKLIFSLTAISQGPWIKPAPTFIHPPWGSLCFPAKARARHRVG